MEKRPSAVGFFTSFLCHGISSIPVPLAAVS